MITKIAQFSILVRDYDEAIRFYCDVLSFHLLEDKKQDSKRWVRIGLAPSGTSVEIVLTKATDIEQTQHIGKQAGGRVFMYLHTNNLEAEMIRLKKLGVNFTEDLRIETYRKVSVFEDLYGNRIDLIEL